MALSPHHRTTRLKMAASSIALRMVVLRTVFQRYGVRLLTADEIRTGMPEYPVSVS
jgi:hypothetical protein